MTVVRIVPPAGEGGALVFSSPHSGRDYPADFGAVLAMDRLRRAEDAYVDLLLEGAGDHGVMLVTTDVPRSYLDLNRAPDDLDPELLDAPWPGPEPLRSTEKSRRGLGLIRALTIPGDVIYDRKLSPAEVRERIARVWRPWHDALAAELAGRVARLGRAWLIDWHSMKSVGNAMTPDGPGSRRPDMVVGDLDGAAGGPALVAAVVEALRAEGFRVAVNDPYKGAEILKRHGRPAAGVHAVQVEINRGLYLDEARLELHDGFAALKAAVERVTAQVAAAALA